MQKPVKSPEDPWQEPDAPEQDVVPWTAEQAEAFRRQNPSVSPWRVVGWQLIATSLLSLLAWVVVEEAPVVVSVAYGGMAVVLPSALFARGLTSRVSRASLSAAVFGFFLWEAVKIGLTLAMLLLAPKLIEGLSWPGLLIGLVVVMKVYWVALAFKRRAPVLSKS